MMNKIAQQLRDRADSCFSPCTGSAELDYAAANEIERLQDRIAPLERLHTEAVKQAHESLDALETP